MGYSKAKWPILGRNLKVPKSQQKGLQKHIKVVLCRKRLEKTPNIRKMTNFVAKTAILHGEEKCQNRRKKDFRNTLKLFYEKTARKIA